MHDEVRRTAGRRAGLVVAVVVLAVGTALGGAVPASADRPPKASDRVSEAEPERAGIQLGPATKFVRESDGSVRQVR